MKMEIVRIGRIDRQIRKSNFYRIVLVKYLITFVVQKQNNKLKNK